jgi:hypothetical protein
MRYPIRLHDRHHAIVIPIVNPLPFPVSPAFSISSVVREIRESSTHRNQAATAAFFAHATEGSWVEVAGFSGPGDAAVRNLLV